MLARGIRAVGVVVGDDAGEAVRRAEAWRARGCRVKLVEPHRLEVPPPYRVRHAHGDGPCERSDRVRLALEREAFDLVEFPARGGLGYRAVQAKRAGLAFADTTLAVRLDATSDLLRRRDGRWPDDPAHLEGDFAERYAFEHACVQLAEEGEALEHARRCGWSIERAAGHAPADRPAGVSPAAHLEAAPPLVSICVPYFNLPHTLPEALASLAGQTYGNLDVLVIDDGSTRAEARRVFDDLRRRYPLFRFERQRNAGIGATRNRGLWEARGEYFLPFDADNVARPDMVERLVAAMRRRPDVAALTCYFLAFATTADLRAGRFLHAYRPAGGPHVLACLRNVYGDATALYRAEAFRAAGGYETDRGTSFEDWEAFVKLVHAGGRIDVVPDHLFYYRHLPTGFSRVTNPFANRQRVVRQFRSLDRLPPGEREALWGLLTGVHLRMERLEARRRGLPYRLADGLRSAGRWLLNKRERG
jgi:glycosyltransferase involved in cell wall biosynthesis